MSTEDLLKRVARIYAALDSVQEFDMSKLPAKIHIDKGRISVFQDFTGGLSQAEIENVANSLIHNIANLEGHLRRWIGKDKEKRGRLGAALKASKSLRIVKDLSNNDKHGYPPHDSFSGLTPQVLGIHRTMRLSTGPGIGSSVAMTFGPGGTPKITGKGSGVAVITGDVVGPDGKAIGDLYEVAAEAVESLEKLLTDIGVELNRA